MLRTSFALAAALMLAVPLTAARSAPRFTLEPNPQFAAAPADSARLYVAREQFVRTTSLSPEELLFDGAPFALLPQRAFVEAVVAAGRHCLSGQAGMPEFCLDLVAGRSTLLRLRENIDDQDQRQMDWLLDDPQRIETLTNALELARATTTPKGLRSIGTPKRKAAPKPTPASASLPLVLDGMWFEESGHPESLKPSHLRETWRVVVDSSGVRATSDSHAIGLSIADITGLRFGGVRGQSNQPWLDVSHRAEGGDQIASFADSRLDTSTATYNRFFAALRDLWLARGGASRAQ